MGPIINEGWRRRVALFCVGEGVGDFLHDLLGRRFGIICIADGPSHHQIIGAGFNGPLGSDHPFLVVLAQGIVHLADTGDHGLQRFEILADGRHFQSGADHPGASCFFSHAGTDDRQILQG